MPREVLRLQIQRVKSNPFTTILLFVIALIVIYDGIQYAHVLKSIAYLAAMWLCTYVIDLYTMWSPPQYEIIVRQPKREGLIVILCIILGFLFFYLRYFAPFQWASLNGFVKLSIAVLIAFVYPIAFVIIFLALGYKLKELGIRLKNTLVALPVIVIVSMTALLVAPSGFTINDIMAETGGIWGALFEGFILAALSEEFWRFIVQTRFGAMFSNKGMGWIVASVVWALMHVPTRVGQFPTVSAAILESLAIVPIGLMWGYMTHRTKSILPSILAHGTNVWGLQNI
ncbi:MAG TPA: CPBP family intramembrane glutamic endopeptidase [Candidatus Kapabacteria bacterium]|nr:CPBP family intramembrane glutamic endopeptidase [Candidatus Kapabacteria bacterium]